MYPSGGIKLAQTGMRNKLFSLHGLILEYRSFDQQTLVDSQEIEISF